MSTTTENYTEPTPLTLDRLKTEVDGCWYGVPVASSEYGHVWAFTHDRRRAAAAVNAWAREMGSLGEAAGREYVAEFLSSEDTTECWGRVIDTCGHIERDRDCDDGIPPCSDEFGWIIRPAAEATPGALPYIELLS